MRPRPNRARGAAIISRARGAAIIAALLVVSLASVVVSSLFWREHVAVRSVENRLALSQSRWIERAALDWAKVILRSDQRSSSVDHLGEPWAVPVVDTRLDETVTAGAKISDSQRAAMLAGAMTDAQGRFNLAGLAGANGVPSERHLAAFRRLLEVLGRSESLADRATQRMLESVTRESGGRRVEAQRPPVMRLADLADVEGFDAPTIAALAPFVVVLPRATPVNINTASPEVVAAMVPGLDLSSARRFVARRERTYFRSLGDASEQLDGRPVLDPALMSVSSSFFIVSGVIRYDRVESQSETLLERLSDRVEVIWQQRS